MTSGAVTCAPQPASSPARGMRSSRLRKNFLMGMILSRFGREDSRRRASPPRGAVLILAPVCYRAAPFVLPIVTAALDKQGRSCTIAAGEQGFKEEAGL